MRYLATAETDVGLAKKTNQDSVLIKQATYSGGEVLLALICDGMGGLSQGEVASATVLHVFAEWFNKELPYELEQLDLNVISGKWELLLKETNQKILSFSQTIKCNMGTTFTAILMVNDLYLIGHIGDTRVYWIDEQHIQQLTEDHSFVAREVRKGNMTPEEAEMDKRRNVLLQCVGASNEIIPQMLIGRVEPGTYMLCSDGFRHVLSADEIRSAFSPVKLTEKSAMHRQSRALIEQVKQRREPDNISVVLIRTV